MCQLICSIVRVTLAKERAAVYFSNLEDINNTIFTFTVPAVSMPCTDLPPGLILLPDYVNGELEQQLLELVNWREQDSLTDVTAGIIE